jgi:hypothetical protein
LTSGQHSSCKHFTLNGIMFSSWITPKKVGLYLNNMAQSCGSKHWWAKVMHSQLLEGFKSESKYKTAEGGRIEARSLTHNTLRGRRACWNSGMRLRRVDKLYSLTWACTQPTKNG